MSFRIRGKHVRQLGLRYVWESLRSGTGITYAFLLLVVGLIIAQICFAPMEIFLERIKRQENGDTPKERRFDQQGNEIRNNRDRSERASREEQEQRFANEMIKEMGMPIAEWATDDDTEEAEYLVKDHPALASAVIMILLFGMPIIVCMGSSNQMSGDIQSKGLRYLLLRVDRSSLMIGRFFGTFLFTFALLFILMLVIVLYLVGKSNFYDSGDVASWMLVRGLFAMVVFAMPYVALCSWISANVSSPRMSLITCEFASFIIPVLAYIGRTYHEEIRYVNYVTPWPLKYHLLSYDALTVVGATLGCVGFTALFLCLGLYTFKKRDV